MGNILVQKSVHAVYLHHENLPGVCLRLHCPAVEVRAISRQDNASLAFMREELPHLQELIDRAMVILSNERDEE
jgi:hypothetical protein